MFFCGGGEVTDLLYRTAVDKIQDLPQDTNGKFAFLSFSHPLSFLLGKSVLGTGPQERRRTTGPQDTAAIVQ